MSVLVASTRVDGRYFSGMSKRPSLLWAKARMGTMLRSVLSSALLCFASLASLAADTPKKVEIMPEDQVKAGMRGVAYTVF